MLVTKRNGDKQPLELDKIESVVRFAAEGLDVDVAGVIKNAKLQFTDGVSTKTIHKLLVKSAVDMISRYSPDYQYLSARLSLYNVRKEAYGEYEAPTFEQHVINMVAKGKYDHALLDFSAHDFDLLEQAIDHNRDNNFTYAAVGQMTDKYLLRPRGDSVDTCAFYESPQMMYMGIACTLIQEADCYDHEDYINKIIKFYNGASTFKFSLPTPIMAGARTPTRQFSSCVLIKAGDSLDSINATSSAITTYVAKKAGIGIDAGMIRPVGSSVRNGELHHTGVVPFLKYFNAALKSCSQG